MVELDLEIFDLDARADRQGRGDLIGNRWIGIEREDLERDHMPGETLCPKGRGQDTRAFMVGDLGPVAARNRV